jgi:iron complex transport system permease protein
VHFGQFRIVTVLLVGIAFNALSSVGIGVFQYVSNDAQLRSLIFWMMGSFGRAHWMTAVPCVLAMVSAVAVLITKSNSLDKLQLGENEAFHLGVDVKATKRDLVLLSAICVGAGVAVSGIIGFVGLVVPHIVRFTIGVRHKPLMIGSALAGGALMVLADLLARVVALPAEVPVGLMTSAIGAPFFLWLITKVKP